LRQRDVVEAGAARALLDGLVDLRGGERPRAVVTPLLLLVVVVAVTPPALAPTTAPQLLLASVCGVRAQRFELVVRHGCVAVAVVVAVIVAVVVTVVLVTLVLLLVAVAVTLAAALTSIILALVVVLGGSASRRTGAALLGRLPLLLLLRSLGVAALKLAVVVLRV